MSWMVNDNLFHEIVVKRWLMTEFMWCYIWFPATVQRKIYFSEEYVVVMFTQQVKAVIQQVESPRQQETQIRQT